MKFKLSFFVLMLCMVQEVAGQAYLKPDTLRYEPFTWKSEPPADCPFPQSKELIGIRFLGSKSGFRFGDTWYPTWAADDNLYSPWTDGRTWRLDGSWELSLSQMGEGKYAQTGQGVIEGNDPMTMKAYSLGLSQASALPYQSRYPSGSLIYDGVWYYGTYCLGPSSNAKYGDLVVNWPWLGPFVGFRYSLDYGRSWKETPHTPEKPLFGETGINGYPVKIGAPHFIDFGKNMEHSPDGKAYLLAHGADTSDTRWRFWNASWINGDQVYLLRVTPSVENMNDITKYEFYSGRDRNNNPVWTKDFKKIKPLLEWNNNMGCVTATYNPGLSKYIMCVTDGGNTASRMNTYILESDRVDGNWKLITYMKNFGEQAYFVNLPTKFIERDGKTAWLLYSGNFATNWNGMSIKNNPPGSHYGMVFQKIEFLTREKK